MALFYVINPKKASAGWQRLFLAFFAAANHLRKKRRIFALVDARCGVQIWDRMRLARKRDRAVIGFKRLNYEETAGVEPALRPAGSPCRRSIAPPKNKTKREKGKPPGLNWHCAEQGFHVGRVSFPPIRRREKNMGMGVLDFYKKEESGIEPDKEKVDFNFLPDLSLFYS